VPIPIFPDQLWFFPSCPWQGSSTSSKIRESAFGHQRRLAASIGCTSKLLKDNPEWGTAARRHDMNHFMAG